MNATPRPIVSKKAILLDGSPANDPTGGRLSAALTAQLQIEGWDVQPIVLREKAIANCGGEFNCWIRTPGTCMFDDDNRTIAEALVASDLVVYLTPVTFGGYSSTLKRMVDHQIQNISPLFTTIDGETHHVKRYSKAPDFLAVGWMDVPNPQAVAVFRHLASRNAINWYAGTCVSDVIPATQSDEEMLASARQWLGDLQQGRSSGEAALPPMRAPTADLETDPSARGGEVRRALLVVGSPRTRGSTSNALGDYLYEQLGLRSIEIETIYLYSALRSPERIQALLDAVDAADLVTLAFPLYVDSLPAPVIDGLERIAAHRQTRDPARRQLFAAVVNCGFPEATQNATALAICELFARQAKFAWAGGLALGAGGMVSGAALTSAGGKTLRMRMALDQAAAALGTGQAIPKAAQEMLAQPLIPHWVYRLMGNAGWVVGARQNRTMRRLGRRPYTTRTG